MARGVPRGRDAPPLEVRIARDRGALTEAALELVEDGVSQLTAEAISRRAGMSKATFYTLWKSVEDFMPDLLLAIKSSTGATASERVRYAAADAGVVLSSAQSRRIAHVLESASHRHPDQPVPPTDRGNARAPAQLAPG
jgi:AcrR family transcriptional regulator